MTKLEKSAVPQWTQVSKKRGIDPLGMQNSSVSIYQRLLPGISNVTLRIRYYGLYVWLAEHYAREIGDTNAVTWQRQVRRAEALYALIAQAKGEETGIGGSDWAKRRLSNTEGNRLDFQDDTEPGGNSHYLQNAWGVFGQAYQSQLMEVRLMCRHTHHDLATTAPGLGANLAHAFASAAGDLGGTFLRAVSRGWTTRKELEQMAPLAPSGIVRGKERDCYEAVLFSPSATAESPDGMRQATLKLILHWARAVGSTPQTDELRWSMYSGFLRPGVPWLLSNELERHRVRWAVYQANDILHVAMETLLEGLLTHLCDYPAGCSQETLIQRAVSTTATHFQNPSSWADFVAAQELSADASDEHHPGSEWTLTRHSWMSSSKHGMSISAQCAAAVRVLAVLQRRMAAHSEEIAIELSPLDPHGFRSLLTELAFLQENNGLGFREMLSRLFLDRVLRRHLWVAMRKLKYQGDYTFLVETDDGLIRKRGEDGPAWTGPRLYNAIAFLKDVGILGQSGAAARARHLLGEQ